MRRKVLRAGARERMDIWARSPARAGPGSVLLSNTRPCCPPTPRPKYAIHPSGVLDSPQMTTKLQAPRGTRDLLPADMATWRALEDNARRLTRLYGYQPIETPMFEDTAVFERGVGEVTDIVEKELFRVRSPGGDADRWALRPEPTAGICRAYVEHGMHTLPQPVKLTMFGSMFRYDRPQAGRYRQFWQFDVEAIGDAGPAIDAEIIELAYRFLGEAGIANVELHLNSIGDANCRPRYIDAFVEYMTRFADE